MKSARTCLVALACLLCPLAQAGFIINFTNTGFAPGSDCPPPNPPQPLCIIFTATGTADDVGGAIPGTWQTTITGMVVNFVGSGTWIFDDISAANNDLFGTFTNTLLPPDPVTGIATSFTHYVITGGAGMFEGYTGSGDSTARIQFPTFAFTEIGTLYVPEPSVAALLAVALAYVPFARRRAAGSRTIRARC